MRKQASVIGIILVVAITAGVFYLRGLDGGDYIAPFDNEGRYDSTILDNMGVIYSNRSDIAHWNDGYSESDSCPWEFIHNGLDYFFFNNSDVIAAAPGLVEDIEIGYIENTTFYKVGMKIRFNESVTLEYSFEGEGNEILRAQQEGMLSVQIGDWLEKGDLVGNFLRSAEYDHVHFAVYFNYVSICPRLVMAEDDYVEIMELIELFHPGEGWQLCYP